MTHPWFGAGGTPRVIAHRGFVPPDSEGVAENTIAAFACAEAIGCRYVESDCHLSRDGRVVLTHDADLARVAGDPRRIVDLDLVDLERIFATRGGLAVLPDVFEAFPTLRFNLDVKVPEAAVAVGRAVSRHAGRVLLTSFSDRVRRQALAAARGRGGRPATSAGTATAIGAVLASRVLGAKRGARWLRGVDALQIPLRHGRWKVLTPRVIAAAHAAGVEVHVWVVDDESVIRQLLAAGVDGVVTDRTDAALGVARTFRRSRSALPAPAR